MAGWFHSKLISNRCLASLRRINTNISKSPTLSIIKRGTPKAGPWRPYPAYCATFPSYSLWTIFDSIPRLTKWVWSSNQVEQQIRRYLRSLSPIAFPWSRSSFEISIFQWSTDIPNVAAPYSIVPAVSHHGLQFQAFIPSILWVEVSSAEPSPADQLRINNTARHESGPFHPYT